MIRLIAAALVVASLTQAGAQRFKTGIEVVRVDALITADRRPIAGLTVDDVELRDSGVRQTVTDVSFERLPLNIICVLDVSGSVSGQPLVRLREGTAAVIDALAADDRAALISFSNRLKVHATLTQDKTVLRDALSGLTPEGATAMLDATFAGLALRDIDPGRTLLLLFSDGIDTASWLTARKVLDAARRTDVVIYPVSVRGDLLPMNTARTVLIRPRGDQSGDSLLDALAEESGGRRFVAERQTDLRQSFLDVLKEFRQRYVLTYTPTGVPADGWHPIEVRVRTRGAEVTARRGYYAAK